MIARRRHPAAPPWPAGRCAWSLATPSCRCNTEGARSVAARRWRAV